MTDNIDYEVNVFGHDFGHPSELVLARIVMDKDYEVEDEMQPKDAREAAWRCLNKLISHKRIRVEPLPGIHVEVREPDGRVRRYGLYMDFQCYLTAEEKDV